MWFKTAVAPRAMTVCATYDVTLTQGDPPFGKMTCLAHVNMFLGEAKELTVSLRLDGCDNCDDALQEAISKEVFYEYADFIYTLLRDSDKVLNATLFEPDPEPEPAPMEVEEASAAASLNDVAPDTVASSKTAREADTSHTHGGRFNE